MAVTIQVRRDTAANWVSVNPVLHQGEPGLETDTGNVKTGDGSTAWNSLGYVVPVFNVRGFGAKGDGVTDDTAAWNAAFAAAVAAGQSAKGNGGTVLFPPGGHYMVSEMDFSSAATANVAVKVVADGAIIQHNASAGGVFVNFSGVLGTAALEFCSFTGAMLYPKQSATNPTTDLVYMTVASHNTLDVKVFDPGMFASSAGSAIHIYARSGSGCYYNTVSMHCAPLPTYSTAYNGNGLTLDGWATSGPYLQSNTFPAIVYQHSAGIGINDLGSGVNVFTWCDVEYASGYGLVVNTNSQGLRFLNFYMEGNNGVTGDQWSIPTGSANAGTSVFFGNLSVSPTDADRSYWAIYQDNAYGGVQSRAGTWQSYGGDTSAGVPLFYGQDNYGFLRGRIIGDTYDRFQLNLSGSGSPYVALGTNTAAPITALQLTGGNQVGPGSTTLWNPFGGEIYPYATSTGGTVAANGRVVLASASGGNITVTLPSSASAHDGELHTIVKTDSTANTVTIAAGSGNTLALSSASPLSSQWRAATFMYQASGTQWIETGIGGPLTATVTLDSTASDIQAAGAQAASTGASIGEPPDSTHVHPENAAAIATDYTVSSTGLKAWNYDLMLAGATGGATFSANPAAGTLYLARVNIRQAITPTKIVIWNNPPTGSPAGYYLALFSSSGTQLGSTSSDQSASSGGLLPVPVGTPGALSAGTYVYVALLIATQGSAKGGASYFPLLGVSPAQYNGGTTSAYRWATNPAATTVASGSNGGEISAIASWASPSAGVLDVATTTGWPTSGTVTVATSTTAATVTYTGTAAGQLTGCAYVSGSATGTVSTGGAVTMVWASMPSSLTLSSNTNNGTTIYAFWCGLQ